MLKTILVAVDGSPLMELVIQALEQFQLQPTTNIIFSHVIPTLESDSESLADRPHPDSSGEFLQEQLRLYQDKLDFRSELEIVYGDPAVEIIRLANIYKADLIILGSRGLTGLNRILQGSVSAQVVAEANCSVLVVKENGE
ncbi:MAG: universal stress protein [Limnoraphis robusta]|uniref:Universal stress protein n=1 Tax=Limnoraphis robusta CCNP1315 TaxID=3110306 RepID=A0ABU5U4U4_9CYAN|nr:universal stress protein [Limnoraphis robusta]MCG5061441.1 universal stress protein [Limnoraphis sp. WC205]MEA5501313.1 universal stress protein [Limnoraphis robusta BA-68 BA1]MEA5522139.1 universal stress protein [Limnoraphis robusta CCNP1315]MEA5542815.1 universal stress protein [Limnoraphis robusta Tam1]MEA5545710.1 universal stress protein [Limnoraphis robusta CCNP1324]